MQRPRSSGSCMRNGSWLELGRWTTDGEGRCDCEPERQASYYQARIQGNDFPGRRSTRQGSARRSQPKLRRIGSLGVCWPALPVSHWHPLQKCCVPLRLMGSLSTENDAGSTISHSGAGQQLQCHTHGCYPARQLASVARTKPRHPAGPACRVTWAVPIPAVKNRKWNKSLSIECEPCADERSPRYQPKWRHLNSISSTADWPDGPTQLWRDLELTRY
jgi:hypothetical protein